MIRPSTLKHRIDVDAVQQNRHLFGQQPARQAAELPVRRRKAKAEERLQALRQMLEPGSGAAR